MLKLPIHWALVLIGTCECALPQPTPAPPAATVPRRLSLAQAEKLLIERNLLLAGSRALVDANRAAKTIAGYKPNPVIQLGAEQVPVAQPSDAGLMSLPRFFTTDSNAGANPVYTLQF